VLHNGVARTASLLLCLLISSGCACTTCLPSLDDASTAAGEVVRISDPRFNQHRTKLGVWDPAAAVLETRPGIYFLEAYSPEKTPVLFVHGIGGSPANFARLVNALDPTRFQPWMYVYPSGAPLPVVAGYMQQALARLERRYRFGACAVIAHSMGGLVVRGFLQRYADSEAAESMRLFVSLATPWDGNEAAAFGVKHSPRVVEAWRDLVPGSAYLQELFATPLPAATQHYLVFTFNTREQKISLASQLSAPAQREAVRLFGFDATHGGVLRDPGVALLIK
jgi:pimeloyl-ACP methyl ester carboxylesterase